MLACCMMVAFVGVVCSASCILIRRDPVDANRVELEIHAGMHSAHSLFAKTNKKIQFAPNNTGRIGFTKVKA